MKNRTRKAIGLALMIAMLSLSNMSVAAAPHATIDLQLVNVSDWHGQLDPLVVGANQVGGAAFLSTYFQKIGRAHV